MVVLLLLPVEEDYRMPDDRIVDGAYADDIIAGPSLRPRFDYEWPTSALCAHVAPGEGDWRPAKAIAKRLGLLGEQTTATGDQVSRVQRDYPGVELVPVRNPLGTERGG
jgi:hypothetical protein